MELKQIKELMGAMKREEIKVLKIKNKDFELHLERPDEAPYPQTIAPPPSYHLYPSHPFAGSKEGESHRPVSSHSREHTHDSEHKPVEGKFVTSPMVGTFYSSPSPDDPHFVKVGDRVEENTVLCIIEAMKVMNEVKAGVSGVIAEILVDNAQPVEFGTKLFRIV